MTRREQAAERLMAALMGEDSTELVLTEDGELVSGEAGEDEEDEHWCLVCDTDLAQATEDQLCEPCARTHTPNYRACDQCRGKRFLYVVGGWYPCGACHGTGRVLTGYFIIPSHER
jgi:uncharacterized protein with PIN domain